MRKLFLPLALIAGSLSMPALADVTFTPAGDLTNSGSLDYVDSKYTKSGEPLIVSAYNKDDVTALTVYNANLESIATVNIPRVLSGSYQEVSYRVLEYNPYGPKDEFTVGYFTPADALQEISAQLSGYVSETLYNGRTIYYPTTGIQDQNVNSYLYIDYWTLGTRYPARCFYIEPVEDDPGLVRLVGINLRIESYLATSQWTDPERKRIYMEEGYEDMEISDYNSGVDDFKYMPLTQTLFNDDDDFEYIKEIKEIIQIGVEETEYVKTVDYSADTTGFAICGSSGNELQRIMFEEKYSFTDFYLTKISDKTYLTVRAGLGGGDYAYVFYTMSGGGSGLQQIGEPIRVSVAPTVIRHDENLNIQLDDLHGEGRITVNDVAGRTVFNTTVEESGIHQIPARNFSNGMNIVTVETPKGRKTSKIIVK